MKKYMFILTLLLIATGCQKEEKNIDTNYIPENNEIVIPQYTDYNNTKIGFYDNNNKLVNDLETTFRDDTDLAIFSIYFTNLSEVDNLSTKVNWKRFHEEYKDIENLKTGFYIFFEANEEIFEELILDSTKTFSMGPYLYIYLYDDVNQPDNTFYSHIEPQYETEDTIFSSIKLYLPANSDKITSPITLTVFTYDGMDDFDENNHYRGNSSYTIEISKRS